MFVRLPALAPSLCALGVSLLVWAPAEAHADPPSYQVSAGLFLSISLGDKANLGLGAMARVSPLITEKNQEAGLFVQGSLLNFSLAWRAAAGLYGEVPREGYRLYGEAGWTYRSALGEDSPEGHGPHLAIGAFALEKRVDVALRGSALLYGRESTALELSPTIGFRYYPENLQGRNNKVVDGRPLYIDDELRHASLQASPGWC
jgi:hypothetical protein